ncbi:MAG: UDP-N-acetylmuramate--L-alanine ligase [Candidatus Omnitrophica bacterium]|nr:UDP-N-acetylmuramate--L-alanine ligase [Candidatus Omnitrophota bacterium]
MTKHIHFIGVGGIGMSGIARILLKKGVKVSGSDLKDNRVLEDLRRSGCYIHVGHSASNINGADLVVYSSAIREDNPEMQEARSRGITVIQRAKMLSELMQDKTVITVTGAHGKTTVTSLIAHLLIEAGLSPTVATGGILRNLDSNAYFGSGEYFVAEADESDGSFLYYKPDYSVITNIDYEHLDYYGNFANILDKFRKFLANTKDNGCVLCCGDDPNLRAILKGYHKKFLLFGFSSEFNIYAEKIEIAGLASEFDVFWKGKFLERFHLSLGGRHNISNALAVIAVALELGVGLRLIHKALSTYQGTQRRLQIKLDHNDMLLVDDYGHHPTEIKATLSAISYLGRRRVIVIFQPHRFTRTKFLLEDFGRSFNLADRVYVTDIYPAGEKPIEGIDGALVAEKIKMNGHKDVQFLPKGGIIDQVLKEARAGDLILTLGAGDITRICDELAEAIKGKNQA